MARVLILSLVFPPDAVSTSTLVSEIAKQLKHHGHRVTVLTTYPHYNLDTERQDKQKLQRKLAGLYHRSTYHDIPVWHTFMRKKGARVGGRIGDYLIFHAISLMLGVFAIGRQDVVLAVSPPLTIGIVGWLLGLVKRARSVYNVQEIYPEAAAQVGVLRRESRAYRFFEWLETFVYRRVDAVSVICESFASHVCSKGIEPAKVHVIPNFADVDAIQPGPKENAFAAQHGTTDRFVILYLGNIGMTQSFDTLLDAAERLQDLPNLLFLIVGDGARRTEVERQVRTRQLANVRVVDYQPYSRVPQICASADVGLVPMMAGTARTTLPSKIYTIMASGRPALVAADLDSDMVKTVQETGCGVAVPPDNVEALEAAIRDLYAMGDQLAVMGEKGRERAVSTFSIQATGQQYHTLVEHLAKRS